MGVALKLNLDGTLLHMSPTIGTILQVTVYPNPGLVYFVPFLEQFFVRCANRA